MIPNQIYNFLMWVTANTSQFQNNATTYKGKVYFLDRKEVEGKDGALNDLWKEYKNELGF